MTHTHALLTRWLLSHVRAMRFAVTELIRTPISNFIMVSVMGIAITLPLGFYVLLENLQSVDHQWDASTPTVSLFLQTNITQPQINSLLQQLRSNTQIEQVNYISPTQGLAEFEKNTPFSDAIKLFQKNPLPGVITILPAMHYQNPLAIQTLYHSLKTLPWVDSAQLDMNWVTRLFDIILIGKKITRALSILFGMGVIFIIGHTLRTSLSTHTKEILVMKLMGATNAYIRRPLLYRGILYGFLGGFVAWILITYFFAQLQKPISQLAKTYNTLFELQTLSGFTGLSMLLLCGLLGFAGAWIISAQFLNQPEQTD